MADQLGATVFPLDLTRTEAIEASCKSITKLDVLVHNAGVSFPGYVGESDLDQWQTTFAVNVFGPVALTLALLPVLRSSHGRVVFVNSGAGRKASPGLAAVEGDRYDPTRFLRPKTVAATVANAVTTPRDGHLHEVIIRP